MPSMTDYQESRRNYVVMTPELRSILDGLLLSDASINCGKGNKSGFITMWQHPSRLDWLQSVQQGLRENGVESVIDHRVQPRTRLKNRTLPGGNYLVLRTLSYVEFVSERDRWWPSTLAKSIPLDLILTSTTVRHWFCGDGRGGDTKGTLGFCTDGFSHEDVSRLVLRFREDLGVTVLKQTNHRGHPQILVSARDEAEKVRLIISPLPDSCVYKLQHIRPRVVVGRGRKLSQELKELVLAAKGTGSCRKIGLEFGVAPSMVWTIWKKRS